MTANNSCQPPPAYNSCPQHQLTTAVPTTSKQQLHPPANGSECMNMIRQRSWLCKLVNIYTSISYKHAPNINDANTYHNTLIVGYLPLVSRQLGFLQYWRRVLIVPKKREDKYVLLKQDDRRTGYAKLLHSVDNHRLFIIIIMNKKQKISLKNQI